MFVITMSIRPYFVDLRNKAKVANSRNALNFIDRKGREKVVELSQPHLNPIGKKQAIKEYKRTQRIIKLRAKRVK